MTSEPAGVTTEEVGGRAVRSTRAWVLVATVCVFGPYLVGGVRTEQLALYVSGLVAAALLVHRRETVRALRPGWPVVVLWAAYAAVAASGAVLVPGRWPWGSGSLVSGLDNALLPLATMTAVALWVRRTSATALLRIVCWVVAVAMALNGALALLTSFVGFEHVPLLPWFLAASGSGTTVAELAAGSGRFAGIFNQPAEAGIAYTLAAFAVIHLVRGGAAAPRRTWMALWALIIVGGLLTLSKIFVVGGVLILAVLILTARRARWVLASGAVATTVLVVALGAFGSLGAWGASGTIEWYVNSVQSGDSFTYTVSAGRFGEAGGNPELPATPPSVPTPPSDTAGDPATAQSVKQPGGLLELGREVLRRSPWLGLGAAGAQVSYDSTWIEALIVGGSVGALLMLAVHLALSWRWFRLRRRVPREEWRLGGAVLVLAWGSSFGMPSLTGNRESSLMWLFLCLLIVFRPIGSGVHRAAEVEPLDG